MRFIRHMTGDMADLMARLWPLAMVALFAEWGYAIMNMAALPLFLTDAPPNGLGAAVENIGPIISIFLISETILKAPLGLAGDHYGRKKLIVLGLFVSALTPFFMRTVTSTWSLVPLRALDGIGAAAIWPCVFASVAVLTTTKERASAMTIFNMMYMVGLALALPSYSLVIRYTHQHRDVFLIISLVFFLGAALALLLVPGTRDLPHHVQEDNEAAVAEPIGIRKTLILAARSRIMLAMLVASIFQATGVNLLNGVLTIYAKNQLKISPENIGMVFIGPAVAVMLLAIPLGWLGNRWGKVKSVRIGLVTSFVALALIPSADSLLMLSLIVVPFVIGSLIATPSWLALITQLAPVGHQGMIVGAVATAQGIGAIIGPTVGSNMYGRISPAAPFYAAAVFILIALVIVWLEFKEDMKVDIPMQVIRKIEECP